MRTSSSGYDAKFVGYFREIRQIVTEAKTPLGNIDDNTSKLLSAIDQEVRRRPQNSHENEFIIIQNYIKDFVLSGKHLKSVQQSVNDLKSEMKKYFEVQKTKNIPETFQNGSSQANYKINNVRIFNDYIHSRWYLSSIFIIETGRRRTYVRAHHSKTARPNDLKFTMSVEKLQH